MGIYTVSQLNDHIRQVLVNDPQLGQVWVRGEISNLTKHSSGHYYFTLKDKGAQISCVSFRMTNRTLKFEPETSMKVLVFGTVDVYTVRGQYQLRVLDMRPDGIGELYKAYEQLRNRLQEEGLFEVVHKKRIPRFPSKVGVVTSPTGAAIHDILHVIERRFPVDVLLSPAVVQGENSAESIVRAIEHLNGMDVDVIIVGRGGGSLEDLWSFNEEIVARAIFNSKIPVISAVGHETDHTIADFVADVRAPTPSAAAEIAVPERSDLKKQVSALSSRMEQAAIHIISDNRRQLDYLSSRIEPERFAEILRRDMQRVDELSTRMELGLRKVIDSKSSSLSGLAGRLNAVSPLNTLERGYSITLKASDNSVVRTIGDVDTDDPLDVRVIDGTVECRVTGVRPDKRDADKKGS
ncbi:exodeoxyribonuclease VII large subunit [Methanolobus profundi]|uniref:Exodeoxyribonuclease VII large subunit n=1 Tax=Methanolobus profundi TaxID=487685 RepID=A0A1I4U3Z7_9EURY|nr:exodeoxyribonuclease VII large subunit [Methanolobus profundi]SFM83738.1 Exodeoxyribonuclease VII large subunit [Methanolobus profundi]